jgi:RHS repeat-associated protein
VYDASQQLRWKWDQDEPFGGTAPDENPGSLGIFEMPLRFPGQYADKETALNYNWFRDYDARLGRYIQSDPIGINGGLNTYAYTDSIPIGSIDPQGLNPIVFAFLRLLTIGMTANSVANDPVPIIGRGLSPAMVAATAKTASAAGQSICKDVTTYGPLNSGPLAQALANTFRSGTYASGTLAQNQTMYRVIGPTGNPAGGYWSLTPPTGPTASMIDNALLPVWGNNATKTVTATIPAGTTVYVGPSAQQGTMVSSGAIQVYIPNVNPAWIFNIK